MARQKLAVIKGIYPVVKAEAGEKVVGTTDKGDLIFEKRSRRTKRVQKVHNGQPVWRKHLRTGEPMHPVNERVDDGEKVERYIKIAGPMGSVSKLHNFEPSPADKQRKKNREAVADMQARLAQALVDEGMTPEELVARLRQAPASPKDEAFPREVEPGKWMLSSGDIIEGDRAEAESYEESVAA